MAGTKEELLHVINSLEAHWQVLEAELSEIKRDLDYAEDCVRKYGEGVFGGPLNHLKELRKVKKAQMKNIVQSMEAFNSNLQGGRDLIRSLERGAPSTIVNVNPPK